MCTLQAAGQFNVAGKIIKEDDQPLVNANIVLLETGKGTTTDPAGNFTIRSIPGGEYTLAASFLGYEEKRLLVKVTGDVTLPAIRLGKRPMLVEEVVVSGIRARENTPVAYTNIQKEEIRSKSFGQDIPALLSDAPSVVTTSDAGNGIGYSSMRLRGTDLNRINVTINGIPLNDAETQAVFWVDLPELASSAEQIQIQRGVGTSTNGAAAFGGSVNIQTEPLNQKPYAQIQSSAGSFNTFRNTLSAGTGLISDRISVDLRLSDVQSDGYIDRSWVDLQSYFLSAGYDNGRSSLKFITFGGFEELYQSWGGVPSSLLSTDRTYNPMGAYTDAEGNERYYENQIDHYDQVHYQLHFSRKWTEHLTANLSGHYTHGAGYYEEFVPENDPYGESTYAFYGLREPVIGNDTVQTTDFIRRKWVENDFYGVIGSVTYHSGRIQWIGGGGWNRYTGLHFGEVNWSRILGENLLNHRWYEGTGDKQDWNGYTKTYVELGSRLTAFLDLQLRGITYAIGGTDAFSRDVSGDYTFLFFNPKAGFNFVPAPGHRAYLSFARANREPNRNNYIDAPADAKPVHECMRDYEAGYELSGGTFSGGVNLYFMDYRNQLVLTGQINEVGYPVMTNVEDSYRAGIELMGNVTVMRNLRWSGNLTLSRNRIKEFRNYIDNWDYWSDPASEPFQIEQELGETHLAFSPSLIAASRLVFNPWERLELQLVSKYVGIQYIDNTSNEAYTIDPYIVNDLLLSCTFSTSWARKLAISVKVANLFNASYETNAWLYRYYLGGQEYYEDGYYPQAGINFMAGLDIRF
jgi:iron complex outermembrane receptor protein